MIAKLWRSTTFRMTVVFGAIFGGAVTLLLGFIYWETQSYLTAQVDTVLKGMAVTYAHMPRDKLADQIDQSLLYDARHISLVGLFSRDGKRLAGNLLYIPGLLIGDSSLHEFGYPASFRRDAAAAGVAVASATQLPTGERLVLGRDVTQLAAVRHVIERALILGGGGILLVGLAGIFALSVRPIRRINKIRETTQNIMRGDWRLRIPESGTHDELDILAVTVNRMLDEIARLLAEVKSVTDTIAHDLRTPLTRLRALLYRTLQECAAGSRERANYEQAVGETDMLLRRFQALLRIAELENRQRHAGFAEIDLSNVANEIRNLFEPLADERGIKMRHSVEHVGKILADPDLIFEALSNLIDNAIKFTPAGGYVTLNLTCTKLGPQVDIRDSGPGVPFQERQAVLQRFYRSSNATTVEGFGLGLSVVSAIVRLHDFKLIFVDAPVGTHLRVECWPHALQAD